MGCNKTVSKPDVLYLPISKEAYPRRPFCSVQCNIDWLLHQADELELIAKEYRDVAKIRAKEIKTIITTGA
jgi:endogenous inhibitor of DNA gyrase (YacG/DUF329 family)